MADETKDPETEPKGGKPGAGSDKPGPADKASVEPAAPALEVGANVPDKAGVLAPEAGSIAPAAEAEAKIKPTLAPSETPETPKTAAKVEDALVEKPSLTPTSEGATEEGKPPMAKPVPAAPPKAAGDKPAPPKAPAAAHKPGEKPAPAKKGPTITVDITGDPFIDRIKQRFAAAITEAVATLGQQVIGVKKDAYIELASFLRGDEEFPFDMCTDLTVVHWPERAGREMEVVLLLYSVSKNRRLRVKTAVADGESCPTVTPIWAGAGWMEREAYDMFGVVFAGHPDLRRILLPSDWPGHPLRKEYPIEYRDNEWTDKHLEYRELDYDTNLIDVKYAERR